MKKVFYAALAFIAVTVVGFLNSNISTPSLPIEQVHADNPAGNLATDSAGSAGSL